MSSQRDSERAMLALERRELAESPRAELAELARIYESKGPPPDLSRYVAEQLTTRDPLAAHAEAELGIDPEQLARPSHAAVASFGSFMAGAVARPAHAACPPDSRPPSRQSRPRPRRSPAPEGQPRATRRAFRHGPTRPPVHRYRRRWVIQASRMNPAGRKSCLTAFRVRHVADLHTVGGRWAAGRPARPEPGRAATGNPGLRTAGRAGAAVPGGPGEPGRRRAFR
jgi:hypothetical protein